LTFANAQAQTYVPFGPADKFVIPSYNGIVSFAVNGAYSSATFENNAWTFTNLLLNGSQPLKNLTISTQNSNVTIVSFRAANGTTFQSARLRYVVVGQGKQTLNLGLGAEEGGLNPNVQWSVIVNSNVFVAEGNGWTVSHDGTMVITGATGNVSVIHYNFPGFYGNNGFGSDLPFYQQHSGVIVIAVTVAVTVIIAMVIRVRNRRYPAETKLVNRG
jgi:hypothetical protein